MSRRPIALLALSLVTLALAACSDTTAPTTSNQLRPSNAAHDAGTCVGGQLTSTGRSC